MRTCLPVTASQKTILDDTQPPKPFMDTTLSMEP